MDLLCVLTDVEVLLSIMWIVCGVKVACGERVCWSLTFEWWMGSVLPHTYLLDHIRFAAVDGRLVGQCLHASTCSQSPSNSSIHGLTLYLVLLTNHSHHSVVFSRSSSLVVTDSSTDTLLPLPLLLVPLLHWMHRATICPDATSLFSPRCSESSWHA